MATPGVPSEPEPVGLRDALHALTAYNHDLVLLDYGNVVIRRDYQKIPKVRLLSGGIGGKDLSHAMFVGKGMLTAAILGEDTVPNSRQILRTIKELNEGDNCGIFVIMQSNADLFNFGLAVERANADCRTRVKLLSINDDRSVTKERYSCGFILLTKVLGAMAEEGVLYNEIYKFYTEIISHIVTVPLFYKDEETGYSRRKSVLLTGDFETQVHRSIIDKKSQASLTLHPSVPLVCLINTTKTLDRLVELGFVKQVIERLEQLGVCLVRIYYGNYVSAVKGTASLTIMKVFDKKVVNYLDAPCGASGWSSVTQFLPHISLKSEIPGLLKHRGKQQVQPRGPILSDYGTHTLVKSVQFACDALISCERQLNTIDAEKSNGNVGSRLKNFAENVNKRINENHLPVSCPYALLKKLGVIAESAINGTMGSIYGVFFESASNVFGDLPEGEIMTPYMWARALTNGIQAMKQYCTREIAESSMFLPLKCAEMAINQEIAKEQEYLQCYGVGISVAEDMAQKTKLPGKKHPDAGAHAVGIWMRAVFEGVKLMSSASNVCEGGK